MKKNSRMFLLFFAGIYALSGTAFGQMAQEAVDESDYAPAVFSFGQAKELRDQFVFWIGKHYRCLYGGKCTRAEKAEVAAEWKRWTVRLGIGAVFAVLAYFAPKGAQKVRQGIVDLSKDATAAALSAIDRGLLAEAIDDPRVPLSAEQRRNRIRGYVQQTVKSALGIPLDAQGRVAEELTEQILRRLETREVELPGGWSVRVKRSTPVPTGASAGAGASSGIPPASLRGPLRDLYPQERSGAGQQSRRTAFSTLFGYDYPGAEQPSGAGAGQQSGTALEASQESVTKPTFAGTLGSDLYGDEDK